MRIFFAGASGAIGRRLTPLLLTAGHEVTGSTRSPELRVNSMPQAFTGLLPMCSTPARFAMRS